MKEWVDSNSTKKGNRKPKNNINISIKKTTVSMNLDKTEEKKIVIELISFVEDP